MAKTSIIIPTYNSAAFIGPCLDSIFRQITPETDVIIVDNGSKDGTAGLVKEKYPQARIIANKTNLGASASRNQGVAISSAEWIITLDSDIILQDNFLAETAKIIKTLPERIGSVQFKILRARQNRIFSTGIKRDFLNRFHDMHKGFPANGLDCVKDVFGACCAAALYRRKMLEEIKDKHGYFDERLFFLFEDAELSWRAQKTGWRCLYSPGAVCFHHGNGSATDRKTRQYFSFRNRQLAILKNENPLLILLKLPFYLAYDIPRAFILLKNRIKAE
jgi:GT2 family glycosyltransferase